MALESLSTTRRKGNIGLDKRTAEDEERKRLRRDCIRQTIAKMERAQKVMSAIACLHILCALQLDKILIVKLEASPLSMPCNTYTTPAFINDHEALYLITNVELLKHLLP